MQRTTLSRIATALILGICLAGAPLTADEPGSIHGTVISIDADGARTVVPGAKVVLAAGDSVAMEASADETGVYRLSSVPPGDYHLSATSPGMSSDEIAVHVTPAANLTCDLELKLRAVQQAVTVEASAPEQVEAADTGQSRTIGESTLRNAPNATERFDNLLPLVPGVVRGPDGLINMKGARASQNGMLVNSANVTDPVTGASGINLPIDVVSTAQVVSNPFDSEYGKMTGAVALVDTRVSDFNKYHLRLQNFLPRTRKRDGAIMGIESATPRLTVSGPIVRNRIAFTQSFEYRYVRTPVYSLPPLRRDTGLESFDSYTQVDLNLTERQNATVTLAFYPEKLRYLGLNTFTTQAASPDLHQRGYFLAFSHKYATASAALLASQLSYKTLDGDLKPQSNDPYRVQLETATGGFFNRQHRETGRIEWLETLTVHPITAFGQHQVKFGTDFVRNAYDGDQTLRTVDLLRASGLLAERIDYAPKATVSARQREYTAFSQDKWALDSHITLDAGVRLDRDSLSDENHFAPRLGIAISPFKGGRTVIRAGAGYFYDRINLNIPTFDQLPQRTVTRYLANGAALAPVTYENRFAGPLQNPRSTAWNVEAQQLIRPNLVARVGYSQRITVRDFFLEPQQTAVDHGVLWLSNEGRSRYREFQATVRYQIRRDVVNASFVRSSAIGDLNDFNQFYGNIPNPVIRPNERGRLSFDAPNRLLLWGEFAAPWKITLAPVFEVHTGFPYSIVDENRDFVGERNRAGRFPRFVSTDLQATKQVRLPFLPKKYKAQVGVRTFNLLNHYNPRDFQSNLASYRYGEFFNSVERIIRGKFVVEF